MYHLPSITAKHGREISIRKTQERLFVSGEFLSTHVESDDLGCLGHILTH